MQSLSCHVKYLCRTCHSKKTTYEQTCFSVSSEFSSCAILMRRLPKLPRSLQHYAQRTTPSYWTRNSTRPHLSNAPTWRYMAGRTTALRGSRANGLDVG